MEGILKGTSLKDFSIIFCKEKGRGVSANRAFIKGEFVIEYKAYKVYTMYALD